MNNNLLVSVLVPIYGVEKYIERCAISLFEQTYQNIEYIFVNDCTSDRSIEILEEIVNRYPNRKSQVRIINHELNKGIAVVRNTLVFEAKGDFVAFVDSDDYVSVDYIKSLVDKQAESDADIVRCDYLKLTNTGNKHIRVSDCVVGKELSVNIISKLEHSYLWGMIIRRSLYVNHDIKCIEKFNIGEDYLTLSQLSYFSKVVGVVHKELYWYDCCKDNSYMSDFFINESKAGLYEQNFMAVECFVKDKGDLYITAYSRARVSYIMKYLIASCFSDDEKSFNKYKSQLGEYSSECYGSLAMYHKPLIYIPSFRLSKLYLKVISFIGRTVRKLKN